MEIDFFARREHFVDHLAPIWLKLHKSYRGKFYVYHDIYNYTKAVLGDTNVVSLIREEAPKSMRVEVPGNNPLVVCAYGDFLCAYKTNPDRVYIMAEHGVGLTPDGGKSGGYAGGVGKRAYVDCFLAPNEYIAKRTRKVMDTTQYVIGTPKLDIWAEEWYKDKRQTMTSTPVICISFHWNGSHISPEASNSFSVFGKDEVLLKLKEKYTLVAHCHPKAREEYKPVFEGLGIPFIENFKDVMEIADIYVNDASSTMYEFLVTGKPVIIMDNLIFRRHVHHGIRFWDYSNIGKHVKTFKQLDEEIQSLISNPNKYNSNIIKAVHDLYPNLGFASEMAVGSILHFTQGDLEMEDKKLKTKEYPQLKNLLSGANNTTKGISNEELLHLAWLGSQILPDTSIVEIGSHRGKSACAIASGVVHAGKKNKIFCIDLWDSTETTFDHYHSRETWEIFQKQVSEMGFSGLIVPKKMSSEEANKAYVNSFNSGNAKPLGLVFIDANHYKPHVENDFRYWNSWITSGGWIAFHDYGTRFVAVDQVVEDILMPSNEWEEYTVIGRIFSARKK